MPGAFVVPEAAHSPPPRPIRPHFAPSRWRSAVRDNRSVWRQLLQYTDTVGRSMVGFAAVALVVAVVSFVVGIAQAVSAHAAGTLPFWATTMGCAVLAGVLVYLASRRGDLRRR